MDSILSILANGENWRLLAILVAVYCFYVSTKSQMKDLGHSLSKKIDDSRAELKGEINELRGELKGEINELRGELKGEINELRGEMKELKYNDFAHLSSAFEALTFTLEKNGSMSKEDKDYVVGRLALPTPVPV
jgi:predicted  nucleic acid-binding Zn-ribbon protein